MPVLRNPSGDGLGRFVFIWSGQFLSQVGTLMTSLALIFWAYDLTGRAAELAGNVRLFGRNGIRITWYDRT